MVWTLQWTPWQQERYHFRSNILDMLKYLTKRKGYFSVCGNGCLAKFVSTIYVDLSKTSSKMVGWFTIRDGINENICSGRFNILHWRLSPCSVHIWCIVCQRHRNVSISVIKRPLCLVSNYQFNYQGRLLQLFLPKNAENVWQLIQGYVWWPLDVLVPSITLAKIFFTLPFLGGTV